MLKMSTNKPGTKKATKPATKPVTKPGTVKKNNITSKANVGGIIKEMIDHADTYLLSEDEGNWKKFHLYFKDEGKKLKDLRFKKTPVLVDYIIYGFVVLTKLLYENDFEEYDDEKVLTTLSTSIGSFKNEGDKQIITVKFGKDVQNIVAAIHEASENTHGLLGLKSTDTFEILQIVIAEGDPPLTSSGIINDYTIGLKTLDPDITKDSIKIEYPRLKDAPDPLPGIKSQLSNLKIGKNNNSLTKENIKKFFNVDNLLGIGVIAFHKTDINNFLEDLLIKSIKSGVKSTMTKQPGAPAGASAAAPAAAPAT